MHKYTNIYIYIQLGALKGNHSQEQGQCKLSQHLCVHFQKQELLRFGGKRLLIWASKVAGTPSQLSGLDPWKPTKNSLFSGFPPPGPNEGINASHLGWPIFYLRKTSLNMVTIWKSLGPRAHALVRCFWVGRSPLAKWPRFQPSKIGGIVFCWKQKICCKTQLEI